MRDKISREGGSQLENIGEIEKCLWAGADTLRANSKFASIGRGPDHTTVFD